MADRYAHGHHASVLASHARRGIDDSAAYLLAHLHDGMTLLDVGCGPGSITIEFAERFPGARVIGIDASDVAVDAARAAADVAGVTNVEFRTGDAYALDMADGSVDVVHAHQVLQHLVDPPRALTEFRRVTRSGGIVAARDVDYEGVTWFPLLPPLREWLDLYLRVARAAGGEPAAARHLRSWFRSAGLDDLTVTGSVWTYASDDATSWWGRSWAQRATASSFAEHAVNGALATPADLERIADGWRAFAHAQDAWFQLPHGEIVARVGGSPTRLDTSAR